MTDLFTQPTKTIETTEKPPQKVNLGPQPECWWTEYVKRHNSDLPADFMIYRFDATKENAPPGMVKLTGTVRQFGPRGGKKWLKGTDRVFFVPSKAATTLRDEVAAAKGGCGNCWGTGMEWYGWGKATGDRYRTCDKCKGTGAATA